MNKPATPLPWMQGPKGHTKQWAVFNADRSQAVTPNCESFDDAAYIVHACNAYPKLVEALRNLGAGLPSSSKSVNDAADLLRELGEL